MKIINKVELQQLIHSNPNGGIVFAEYRPDIIASDIMVTDGEFGATEIVPYHGEIFDYDWNIGEYIDSDMFVIFDNNDILQIIQTLVIGLNIELETY